MKHLLIVEHVTRWDKVSSRHLAGAVAAGRSRVGQRMGRRGLVPPGPERRTVESSYEQPAKERCRLLGLPATTSALGTRRFVSQRCPGAVHTDTHHRVRADRIDTNGKLTLRVNGRLHHIAMGRTLRGRSFLVSGVVAGRA